MKNNTFLEFGKFSDFIKHLDKDQPVNVQAITEGEAGSHSIVYQRAAVICSQLQPSTGEVFSWYWLTAEWQEMGGSPLGETHEARSESGFELAKVSLAAFTQRPAVLAAPKTLKHLSGTNDLARYDKEKDLFLALEEGELHRIFEAEKIE